MTFPNALKNSRSLIHDEDEPAWPSSSGDTFTAPGDLFPLGIGAISLPSRLLEAQRLAGARALEIAGTKSSRVEPAAPEVAATRGFLTRARMVES